MSGFQGLLYVCSRSGEAVIVRRDQVRLTVTDDQGVVARFNCQCCRGEVHSVTVAESLQVGEARGVPVIAAYQLGADEIAKRAESLKSFKESRPEPEKHEVKPQTQAGDDMSEPQFEDAPISEAELPALFDAQELAAGVRALDEAEERAEEGAGEPSLEINREDALRFVCGHLGEARLRQACDQCKFPWHNGDCDCANTDPTWRMHCRQAATLACEFGITQEEIETMGPQETGSMNAASDPEETGRLDNERAEIALASIKDAITDAQEDGNGDAGI